MISIGWGWTPYPLSSVKQQGLGRPPGGRGVAGLSGPALWIVQGVGGEHGGKDFEPSVGHAAQGSAVGMTTGAHLRIGIFAGRVPDDAGARPVVEGVT